MSARRSERIISSLRGRRFRQYTGKKRGELFCGVCECQLLGLKVPLRNDDDIQRHVDVDLVQPEVLTDHPFYSVARRCISHFPAHGEAQADALTFTATVYEQDETSGEMLPAPFVTGNELRACEQPTLLVPS